MDQQRHNIVPGQKSLLQCLDSPPRITCQLLAQSIRLTSYLEICLVSLQHPVRIGKVSIAFFFYTLIYIQICESTSCLTQDLTLTHSQYRQLQQLQHNENPEYIFANNKQKNRPTPHIIKHHIQPRKPQNACSRTPSQAPQALQAPRPAATRAAHVPGTVDMVAYACERREAISAMKYRL
jgi:hypothetical protein